MATTQDFIEFVCDQIRGSGMIRYRKMFGEYMVYVNDKPILLVCDNTVYVKQLDAVSSLMKHADTAVPYAGAKEHYILDIENRTLAVKIVEILEPITALPKSKRKSNQRV